MSTSTAAAGPARDSRPDRRDEAACRDADPELFFPEGDIRSARARLRGDDAGLAHRIPPATTRLPARNAAALAKAARYRRLPAPGCPRTGAHRAELGESERFAAAAGFADSGLATHRDQYLFTAQRYAEDTAGSSTRYARRMTAQGHPSRHQRRSIWAWTTSDS